jgi:hypothetical protein
MTFYRVRRMWTALLVLGIPTALGAAAWALFLGGRASTGALAAAYLLIVIAGRAHAAEMERRAKPMRRQRVNDQLERVRSTISAGEPRQVQSLAGSSR